MNIVINASQVSISTTGRIASLELDIQDTDLSDIINSTEGWDEVDENRYLDYKRIEVKESD